MIASKIPVNNCEFEALFERAENSNITFEITSEDIDHWATQAQIEIDNLFNQVEISNFTF